MQALKSKLLPLPRSVRDLGRDCAVRRAAFAASEERTSAIYQTALSALKEIVPLSARKAGKNDFTVILSFSKDFGKEDYALSISEKGIRIEAGDDAGFFYAVQTLRQIAEKKEDRTTSFRCCRIKDAPQFPERGIFLEDRYGSEFLTMDNYREILDNLAAKKFNSLTLGVYGCWAVQYDNHHSEYLYLPFQKHPELKTPTSIKYYSPKKQKYVMKENLLPSLYEKDFFSEIVSYAAARNIKIRPLFNSFGHNTLIPREHPEVSARDEKGKVTGKGLCTSNPKTRKLMFELYDEIVDRYMLPNGLDEFHIGFDEVQVADFCKCPKCTADTRENVALDYAIALIGHLKKKGVKCVHMYHDTVFPYYKFPPKTASSAYTVIEKTQEEIDELAKKASDWFVEKGVHDQVVIDYWNYARDERLFGQKRLNSFFPSVIKPFNGYYHWVGLIQLHDNVRGCARRAKELGFKGVEAYASWEQIFDRNNAYIALASWNTDAMTDFSAFNDAYISVAFPEADAAERKKIKAAFLKLDELGNYEVRKELRFNLLDYYWASYKKANLDYPRSYMQEIRNMMEAEPEVYHAYLDNFVKKAKSAMETFKGIESYYGRVYYAAALHFFNLGSLYRDLQRLWEKKLSPERFLARSIPALEEDLAVSEEIRIPATFFHYARNLTIVREILLLAKKEYEKTGVLDLMAAEAKSSPRLQKLR